MVSVMFNLAKLDDGFDESPTVMVGEDTKQKNRGILKPSWAFVATKICGYAAPGVPDNQKL